MKKKLLTLAVACLLCLPAFAADDQKEPEGISDIQEIGKVIRNPLTLEASRNPKMNVVFNHATHKRVRCQTCHHEQPSDISAKYVGCGASEECHYIKGSKERDVQSLFWAYHTKNTERSCYGWHRTM
ncbi:cytochrome c3 family protein, partial [uncultured Bilophila sp.]|uniref:cytochrome c3 family protein n=1 Tax=uncultured Bilophila sp. TaxID=529385 RepID=UPI002607B9D0